MPISSLLEILIGPGSKHCCHAEICSRLVCGTVKVTALDTRSSRFAQVINAYGLLIGVTVFLLARTSAGSDQHPQRANHQIVLIACLWTCNGIEARCALLIPREDFNSLGETEG